MFQYWLFDVINRLFITKTIFHMFVVLLNSVTYFSCIIDTKTYVLNPQTIIFPSNRHLLWMELSRDPTQQVRASASNAGSTEKSVEVTEMCY